MGGSVLMRRKARRSRPKSRPGGNILVGFRARHTKCTHLGLDELEPRVAPGSKLGNLPLLGATPDSPSFEFRKYPPISPESQTEPRCWFVGVPIATVSTPRNWARPNRVEVKRFGSSPGSLIAL